MTRRLPENVRLTTHAEVLTPDHPIWQPYLDGHKETPPGRRLREVLDDTDGLYEVTLVLPDKFMVDVREAAMKTTDATLAEVARTGRIWISFEHLRGLDPDTRITYGCSLGPADCDRPDIRSLTRTLGTVTRNFDGMSILTGDDLLAGPRGRVLCMAIAHRLNDRVWSAWHDAAWHLGDTTRLDALLGALTEVDVSLGRVWHDQVTFLEPVADTVAFAMYWQPPRDEEVITANPQVQAALRPLAGAIAAAPATAWWNSPVDLNTLRSTHWTDSHSPTPALTGAATNLLKWRAETVAQNLAAKTDRPPRAGVQYSGTWWSAPTMASLISTTRPLAQLGAIELAWHEDSLGFKDASIQSLETIRQPKVWEIDRPQAWVDLVETYPLDVTDECRHDWQRTTGREGAWYIPDWAAVAADWDAVHVTVAGYLTTATQALPLPDEHAATMLAGWNPDQTWWLADILRRTAEPDHWHNTEENGDPNWHRIVR